jgi:hypothetical protein
MGGIAFQNLLNSQSETVCQILQLLTYMVFLRVIQVFLQVT